MVMNWDWGPTAGSFIGAGIPALLAYLKLRSDRGDRRQDALRQDAGVIADARQLLDAIEPHRRARSLRHDQEVQVALDPEINRRRDDVTRGLLILATSHPSYRIGLQARLLSVEISNAVWSSNWVVVDMLRNKDYTRQMETAETDHTSAMGSLAALDTAISAHGGRVAPSRRR